MRCFNRNYKNDGSHRLHCVRVFFFFVHPSRSFIHSFRFVTVLCHFHAACIVLSFLLIISEQYACRIRLKWRNSTVIYTDMCCILYAASHCNPSQKKKHQHVMSKLTESSEICLNMFYGWKYGSEYVHRINKNNGRML